MKYFKHCFLPLFALVSVMCSCNGNKENPEPTPTPDPKPKAPTAITLSTSSLSAKAEGETFEITVKTPFVPQVEKPDWVTVSFGPLKDYTVTGTVTVARNAAFESRTATLTFKATGATSAKLDLTQAAAEEPKPGEDTNWELIKALGLGWNMGNHFDAFYNYGEKDGYPDETAWQPNKATQATFDGLKELGFSSVRIPISWLKMIGPAPDYKIDETWMNRIYEVVGFAHTAGLKVIINTHHDENHGVNNDYQWQDIKNAANNSAKNEAIKAEIKAVWTQIANKFKDCEDWLIMEGFNEINDGGWGWSADFRANPEKQCNILNEWNQVFVNAVRATGGNNATRWLGCPTYAANPTFEQYWALPEDPAKKVMMAVHFYDPSSYTIGDEQYSDWGHTAAADKKAAGSDEPYVNEVFGNLYLKYVSHGIPVYLGEFGCSMRDKSDTRAWAFYKYYLEYIVKAAKTYGLPCYLWDNGATGSGKEHHGYINHATGKPMGNSAEVLKVMANAWNNDSESYTLQSVYSKAPKF